MNKYEQMVAHNQELNMYKEKKALTCIDDMLSAKEPISVSALVKKTGLSRDYFYKNENVRSARARAIEHQKGMRLAKPQCEVINKALARKVVFLEKKNRELEAEIKKLKEKDEARVFAIYQGLGG